jgi:hypothetical protein
MEDGAWEVHDTSRPDCPMDAFRSHWRYFHEATPFGEAEREWLFENVSFHVPRQEGEIEDQLGGEPRVISEGVHKVIAVQELIRRWLAWRQQTDEFSDQGTLDRARTALAHLMTNVTPDTPLPKSYTDLGV